MLEDAFRAMLLSDADVAAVVAARVYPIRLPQDPTLPAISYQTISHVPTHSLAGPSTFAWRRVQVDAWATTQLAANDLRDKVRLALDGRKGAFGGTGEAAVDFDAVLLDGLAEDYDPESKLYQFTADFVVQFQTVTP